MCNIGSGFDGIAGVSETSFWGMARRKELVVKSSPRRIELGELAF